MNGLYTVDFRGNGQELADLTKLPDIVEILLVNIDAVETIVNRKIPCD